jgi:hypothetical protein
MPKVGDLEQGDVFANALAARAHGSAAGREVMLFVVDKRHVKWAHNLLLNLEDLGLAGRALGIAQTPGACDALLSRGPDGSVSCGHSSYLRRGANATVDAALDRWHIGDLHVYHLWWQRWRYMSWAVRLGYNAMSLDTDISIRVDPYRLFHGALAHRHLLVGIDSEASGKQRPGLFPMVNVGLVYCQRCAAAGSAARVLSEVSRRIDAFLFGPVLWKTKHARTFIAERVLWEQDLFKDALEHVAFNLPPSESRHARENANPPEGGFPKDPTARQRGWRFESLPLAPGLPPQPSPWLLLPDGATRRSGSGTESAAGLPLWIFSPWNVPPHGAACAGQWASRPSPVMIGHLVGCTSKHLMMRQLGWWHYEVSAHDALAAGGGGADSHLAKASPAVASPAGRKARAAAAATLPTRAFPPDARVLVLRWHGLHMAAPKDIFGVWDVTRRFSMLALALGRRAVLPLIPCELAPCAPRVPNPLRSNLYTVSLGDPAACEQQPRRRPSFWGTSFSADATTERDLTPRSVDSALGWAPSPNTSRWWWEPGRRGGRQRQGSASIEMAGSGCCQPIPHFGSCIDPAGARRPLGLEPLLSTADLARLLEENRPPGASVPAGATPQVSTALLDANWTEYSLDALKRLRGVRVLALDAADEPLLRLPSAEWLAARGGAAASAAEEAIGNHAAKCFRGLARAETPT